TETMKQTVNDKNYVHTIMSLLQRGLDPSHGKQSRQGLIGHIASNRHPKRRGFKTHFANASLWGKADSHMPPWATTNTSGDGQEPRKQFGHVGCQQLMTRSVKSGFD